MVSKLLGAKFQNEAKVTILKKNVKRNHGATEIELNVDKNETNQLFKNKDMSHKSPLSLTKDSKYPVISEPSLQNDEEILREKEAELKEIQERIAHLGRLANLGTMGATIVHELSTPLTIVTAEAEEILQALEKTPTDSTLISECAENIRRSAMRMHKVVGYVRYYASSQSQTSWRRLNINEPINNALILLKPQLVNTDIEIDLSLSDHLPEIWGDADKLESIFQNLIVNARDAFLAIRDGRDKILRITSSLGEDDTVTVKIADNAGGIPKNIRGDIFKPFFTTKKALHGTGLGLAISHQLVKEHNGDIRLTSENGEGTEFTLCFPVERRKHER